MRPTDSTSPLLLPLQQMWRRVEVAREDSDTAFVYDLLILGEFVVKLTTGALLAGVVQGPDRNRYRLEHKLIRANGVGDWVEALNDILVGPTTQDLLLEVRDVQRDLTKRCNKSEGAWQWPAVEDLQEVCGAADVRIDPLPGRVSVGHWFDRFAALRNRTKAHGAPTGATCAEICQPLERSLRTLTVNMSVLSRPWAYLHRNLSGKYKVVPLGPMRDEMEYLKREKEHTHPNGIYIWFGKPCRVPLIETDSGLTDFYVANGDFKDQTAEGLSYISDTRTRLDASGYLLPPGALPASETDARPELDTVGDTFTDTPPPLPDYVIRADLEQELHDLLMDAERFPIVTLVGRGGIGKTSTALKVLQRMAQSGPYFAILWFSARDIDLLPEGPRIVQPQILTVDDIAAQFVEKLNPQRRDTKGFRPSDYVTEVLSDRSGDVPLLAVFDNFETVRNPADVYAWLSNAIRLPNKALITTRFREFKADYPVEVGGMTEGEFNALVEATADRLGLAGSLSEAYVEELYNECDGHPYVAKILLGEAAIQGGQPNVRRVLAAKEDVLDALFERTFELLPPAAQRVFLTLCNWRSHIPRLAIEAALIRPANERIDVAEALDILQRSSLVQMSVSPQDAQEWLSVPLAAHLFGQRKLTVSPMKSAIDADTKILHAFGAARGTDLAHGLEPAVGRLVRRIAETLQEGAEVTELTRVLEFVAGRYPKAWMSVADLALEVDDGAGLPDAATAIRRYLETQPGDIEAWRKLADVCRASGDAVAEMNARLQLATQSHATMNDVSEAANRFNYLRSERELDVDSDEKRVMAERFRSVLVERLKEADATDLSRLAWLCLHLGDRAGAARYARMGLELDPTNHHCLRLDSKLAT